MGWASEGRTYPTEHGKVWSSTTILGMKDKSYPLMFWASALAGDFIEHEILEQGEVRDGNVVIPEITLADIIGRGKRAFQVKTTEAADIGTTVHRLVEAWCKGKKIPLIQDPLVKNAFDLFLSWAKQVDLEPLVVEQKVWSLRHEYGGTLDIVARGKFNPKWRKKRVYTIDTKTSKGIYETFAPQVASYTEAYRERAGEKGFPKIKIDGEGIIRVGKEDGKPEWADFTEHHDINFQRFLALKDAYILWNGRPK